MDYSPFTSLSAYRQAGAGRGGRGILVSVKMSDAFVFIRKEKS